MIEGRLVAPGVEDLEELWVRVRGGKEGAEQKGPRILGEIPEDFIKRLLGDEEWSGEMDVEALALVLDLAPAPRAILTVGMGLEGRADRMAEHLEMNFRRAAQDLRTKGYPVPGDLLGRVRVRHSGRKVEAELAVQEGQLQDLLVGLGTPGRGTRWPFLALLAIFGVAILAFLRRITGRRAPPQSATGRARQPSAEPPSWSDRG